MIGYIKIFKPELKVKDLQIYESYYCGICKSLKSRYGLYKNMTLNYDCVFFALLIDALNDVKPESATFRCAYNPGRKKIRVVDSATNFTSDVNIYLTYKKLQDDYHDEKKILAATGSLLLKGAGKKAGKYIGDLKDIIDENLNEMIKLEEENCKESDKLAHHYGKIISTVCSHNFKDQKILFKISSHIGYNVGKWVYLIDAYDDIEKDIKNNSFNPLLLEYKYQENEDIPIFKERIKEIIRKKLYTIMDEAVKAYELVDENRYSPVIYNILLEGIYNKTNLVIEGKCNYGKQPI